MEVKSQIEENLAQIIQTLSKKEIEIEVASSDRSENGDYFTNSALKISSILRKNPREIAEQIKKEYEKLHDSNIAKIEIAGPGFINFFLSNQVLRENMYEVFEKGDSYGRGNLLKNKKIMLEFADPNPFKEFHIGHLRNIILGESYARLNEAQNADFWRVNYEGDVGMHVAKALWGMQELLDEIPREKAPLAEKAKFLGKAYAAGALAYEESEAEKAEIRDLNVRIYKKDPSVETLWKKGREWSLEYFETIYKRLGTIYKRYYFESEVAEKGREIVLSHIEDGVFERDAGAVVYRGESEGNHTRVFVTSEDYATYEAKDMALAGIKYKDFAYDRSIIITAHEQVPYFKVVLSAMKKVFPELAAKTEHDSFGFVTLKDAKMSSRLGNVVTGEWLLSEAAKKIKENYKKVDDETGEKIAVGAVKYSMLKYSKDADISFSFDDSISLDGNSGPYIQYAYVRTQSILEKADKDLKLRIKSFASKSLEMGQEMEKEELELLRHLVHFAGIISVAAATFAPNILCNYLFDLSQKFNLFYQKHQIINIEDEEVREFRLALTAATGQVIKNGLYLLGIETVERM